jgi:HPt (histidine-containing phosphotransfer) domain-containing protein
MVSGLRRAGDKEDLYLWLLRSFLADHAETPAQIERAMAEERWEEAHRLAHTVKGLLGSMGALDVQPQAEALEQALKERQAAWRDRLAAFSEALAPLLSALRERVPPEAAAPAGDGEAQGGAALPAWLDEFETLLGEGDFRATERWESGKAELTGVVPARTIRRISDALAVFDYEQARALASEAIRAAAGGPSEVL